MQILQLLQGASNDRTWVWPLVAKGVAAGNLVAIRRSLVKKLQARVSSHYKHHWGSPQQRFSFTHARELDVLKWGVEQTGEEVAIYATLGASAWKSSEAPSHRVEYFLGLNPEHDGAAAALAVIGIAGFRGAAPARAGDVLDLGEPLWSGTGMDGFMVPEEGEDILPPLESVSVHVQFLQVVPLFPGERELAANHGPSGLLRIWEPSQVPYWDPNRSPLQP